MLKSEGGLYSNMFCFHTKGEMLLVFLQNGQNVISLDPYKNRVKKFEMPNGQIKSIDRWSAFVVVQYENYAEFFQFDKKELIDSVSKVMLTEPILNIQYDLALLRYIFVQTKTQIYLYDCDNLL